MEKVCRKGWCAKASSAFRRGRQDRTEDAEKKCPTVCAAHLGTWTKQWTTAIPGKMSVCECEFDTEKNGSTTLTVNVIAGSIWSNEDAKEKCPIVCASYGGEWTGQWSIPKESWGKMSVCECKSTF